jgi:polyphosphate kinase
MSESKPNRYFSRDVSWVEFNARVLDEALNPNVPLLERLKFLAIVSSNFDEFFMVRVAGLKRQLASAGGLVSHHTLVDEYETITARCHELVAQQSKCLRDEVLPALAAESVTLLSAEGIADHLRYVRSHFEGEIFPVLTPIAIGEQVPILGNLMLHVACRFVAPDGGTEPALAVVPLPESISRFHLLPSDEGLVFALLEDIVIANLSRLFPGREILDYAVLRSTRDADVWVDEERDDDFKDAMSEVLEQRRHGGFVRLEIATESCDLRNHLRGMLELSEADVYTISATLDLAAFMGLVGSLSDERRHLCNEKWLPQLPEDLADVDLDTPLWQVLARRDVLLHHPYESFDPVVRLLEDAAVDDNVLAIKMTLYRTSGDSPVSDALIRAARNGKQVTVLVELKARFDEARNISRANELEQAGAIVIYGLADLKVHSKAMMIVRREPEGIRQYLHLGTGNYNEKTARLYVDMGLLTSNEELAYELSQFFNAITGHSSVPSLTHLTMAPTGLKRRLLQLIAREASRSSEHEPGLIMAKMNSLADPEVIHALYEASRQGVCIQLNVRGICTLVPGVKGMSENIDVISIVDRYLEHTRILYVQNGGSEEIYLGSADWMPRNLDRRVELMFPIHGAAHRTRIRKMLKRFFADNTNAHRLLPDGSFKRLKPKRGEKAVNAQCAFYAEAEQVSEAARQAARRHLKVRRKS